MQVDGYSLDAQRDKLRKYAAYEDMVVAGEYSDEGFSGKNIQGRQEFQRMLNDIQDGKDGVSYVLVFKLSRFGRNAADVLNSLQLMQDFGVNLICVEDGIDSSKDAGKLMISVLSAVAEIERENIRTQTMAGREQKAREGKWNGGFAPYGYKLENGNLVIAEDEVEVIRVIYDRYIHTNEGVAGVAKYLNRNGFIKKLRQNNTIPGFSRNFVQDVLDNPVYMGKIAYGRRRTEKKQGTRNEMHVVEQSEFPVYDGQHEAIISEEDWYLAQEKRKINSFKREKVNNPDHAHILSGILKCPCCGKSMYGNIAKAHSKDKKTRYYYYCKNTVTPTGHECSFRLNIEQTEINKFVAKVISAMVNNPRFVEAIQAKIGTAVDTEDMEKRIAVLQGQLKQAFGTKSRLERQMDTLDINDAHYDRKILDLQRRYDEQYDTIEEIEVQIGELQSQIRSIQQEKISGDNIYRLLLAFDEVYHSATEAEQKEFMKAFIERIEMFPEKRKDGSWIRKIVFNFPLPVDGEKVKELPLETETTVECVVCLSREKYAGGDETMLCDMHTHSNCSDGSFSPEELIEEAKKEGIAAIALCDHNTVSGLTRFINAAKESGVIAVPGVEITSAYKGKEVHILGLFLKERHYQKIANYLEQINIRKIESNKLLAKRLNEGGYVISYDAVLKIAGKAIPNRVHFAKALFAKGYVSSVAEAFDTILAEGGEFYKPAKKLDSLEVIRFLHAVDAVTVLAHPFLNFSKTELCEFLQKAKQYGLVGMETIYPLFSKEDSALAQEIAKEFALIASGGTDFHGINKPDIKLGRGKHNIFVPYEVYENLRRASRFPPKQITDETVCLLERS